MSTNAHAIGESYHKVQRCDERAGSPALAIRMPPTQLHRILYDWTWPWRPAGLLAVGADLAVGAERIDLHGACHEINRYPCP